MNSFWLCLYAISLLLQYQTGVSVRHRNTSFCRQDQRQLLLQFSHHLHPDQTDYYDYMCDRPENYYKTKYWNDGRDCCGWDGVTCDASTGFVVALDLSCGGLAGIIHSNSTLFRLTRLQNLNLAFNHFNGSQISAGFGWLIRLTHLNLSNSMFSSPVPRELYYLSNLISLDISFAIDVYFDLELLARNMTRIEILVLTGTNISSEIPSNVSSFLTHLDLGGTGVHGNLPLNFFERPNLQVLRLGGNDGLKVTFPGIINGSNVHSFRELDLSETSISGRLPESIGLFNNLAHMDFNGCNLRGSIPESIGNITEIEFINMSFNNLSGEVPSTISNLRRLISMELSQNHLGGQLPDALANLQDLHTLVLSDNFFRGEIPPYLSNMSQLFKLDISSNTLTGSVPSIEYQRLQNLNTLSLHDNELEGTIPSSICNLTSLYILILSNNKFRGKLPECIGNSSHTLGTVELRRNELTGTIPTTFGYNQFLQVLALGDNHMEGPLPRSLANCSGLAALDLGKNMIRDTFPWWLQTLPELRVLVLKYNSFHGSISPPVANNSFSELQIIDLSHNNFSGLLPDAFFAALQAMRQAPSHVENGHIYLSSVTLFVKGDDREFTDVRPIVKTIDFSRNNFCGSIPESLAYLAALWLLNLSHNSFSGGIPPAIGHLATLEQLDLSSNQLTGAITKSLTNLTSLEVLNLSFNHLDGPIPEGGQFSTFPRESYVGNLGLYGAPLTRNYWNGIEPPSPTVIQEDEDDDDDSGFMTGFSWQAVAQGYGCGVVIGFVIGSVMLCIGKPRWFARFYYTEAANCLRRRNKRGRVLRGRR